MNIASTIYMERKNTFLPFQNGGWNPSAYYNEPAVLTMSKNFESLGFVLSKDAVEYLSQCSMEKITEFYQWILPILHEKSAVYRYNPMYPNFPHQVMEASDFELYLNAILHYWSDGTWSPEYAKEARLPLHENVKKPEIIRIGNAESFMDMFVKLISSNTSISETDKNHLYMLASSQSALLENVINMTSSIPQKEIATYLASLAITFGLMVKTDVFAQTATDVLRIAVALSGGDVSLATNTRFKSFNRKTRRDLLNMLNNCNNDIVEDMARYPKRWIRLGERLHPFEFPEYPRAFEAFNAIRNFKVQTFNGKVQSAIEERDLDLVLNLLEERPGEFARRLHHLLRKFSARTLVILAVFESVASKVSTPVLLQMLAHFSNASRDKRVFLNKGMVAKPFIIDNNLPELPFKDTSFVIETIQKALKFKFSKLDAMKNVYIDNRLFNILIPSSQRSASEGTKNLVRGSRLSVVSETSILRGFIHWKNTNKQDYRVDLDLSSVAYDENWQMLDSITYYNLRNKYGAHSGDKVDGSGEGACEFVDMNIPAMIDAGVRYVAFSVNSFTHQSFSEIDCTFGWMERVYSMSGEIFEPSTVVNRIKITSSERMFVPVIFDVMNMQFIWADVAGDASKFANNVRNNKKKLLGMGTAIAEMSNSKLSMGELFTMHVEARNGIVVSNPANANFCFGLDEGDVTAYDLEKIASEYMA